jgi:hypothetical protein
MQSNRHSSLSTFVASALFPLQNNPTEEISANTLTVKLYAENTLGFIDEEAVIL